MWTFHLLLGVLGLLLGLSTTTEGRLSSSRLPSQLPSASSPTSLLKTKWTSSGGNTNKEMDSVLTRVAATKSQIVIHKNLGNATYLDVLDAKTGDKLWNITFISQVETILVGGATAEEEDAIYILDGSSGDPFLFKAAAGQKGYVPWLVQNLGNVIYAAWTPNKRYLMVVSQSAQGMDPLSNPAFLCLYDLTQQGKRVYNVSLAAKGLTGVNGLGFPVSDNDVLALILSHPETTHVKRAVYLFSVATGAFLCKIEPTSEFLQQSVTLIQNGFFVFTKDGAELYSTQTCAKLHHNFGTTFLFDSSLTFFDHKNGEYFYVNWTVSRTPEPVTVSRIQVDVDGSSTDASFERVWTSEPVSNGSDANWGASVGPGPIAPFGSSKNILINNAGAFTALDRATGAVAWKVPTTIPFDEYSHRDAYALGADIILLPSRKGYTLINTKEQTVVEQNSNDAMNLLSRGPLSFEDAETQQPFVVFWDVGTQKFIALELSSA